MLCGEEGYIERFVIRQNRMAPLSALQGRIRKDDALFRKTENERDGSEWTTAKGQARCEASAWNRAASLTVTAADSQAATSRG